MIPRGLTSRAAIARRRPGERGPGPLSGQARLTTWLKARAARDRVVALEEALLGGTFWRFAIRRLSVFMFARGWATALHILELSYLTEIFIARPFVASLALQNATLVVDAFWWGALEALRRRARAMGVRAQAQVLTTRYMTVAFIAGLLGCCVPLARMAWRWRAGGIAPTMLDAYALVCLLRLALDMVLRALYSGVYAYGRVHRPAWSAPISSTVLVGLTVALWPWLAGWSFVVALLVSVLCARALLLRFTLRAYRLARVPLPAWRWRWRWRWRGGGRGRRADWHLLGESALAGIANLTTRLASVVLLGAVLPSLGADGDGDGGGLLVVAYVLHLASPLILITSQWGFVFYHDWKRLEADVAALLARRLHWCLLAVGAFVAGAAWGATALLAVAVTGWRWAVIAPVLTTLAPTYLGLSIWTALQLRGFSRGEFTSQALSAGVVIAAVAICSATAIDPTLAATGVFAPGASWYWMLAGCPFVAIAAHALFARWLVAPPSPAPPTLDTWVRWLKRQPGPVIVWRAQLAGPRPVLLADEVRRALPSRGRAVPWRRWLFCYEPAPGLGRQAWLVRGAGLLTRFDSCEAPRGDAAADQLVERGWLTPPTRGLGASALERAHTHLFPGGFTLRVGGRAPAAFTALPADIRQTIWRDAIRRATTGRRRTSAASAHWRITTFAPDGNLSHIFVAPRGVPTNPNAPSDAGPVQSSSDRDWAELLQQSAWRVP